MVRTSDKHLATICRGLLLLAGGHSRREVAARSHVHPVTVSRWASRFQRRGLGGLRGFERGRSGRPLKIRGEHIELLRKSAVTPPSELGKPFSRWTLDRLARYFHEQAGIKIRPHYIGLLLRRMGISWSRPEETSASATRVSEAVVLWISVAKVQPANAKSSSLAQRVLLAAVNLGNGQTSTRWAHRRTPATFIQFWEQLLQEYLQQRLILVAETGCVQISRQVGQFLDSHRRRLEIVLLSSSPRFEKHKISGTEARISRGAVRFPFNSPEALAAKISRGIREIQDQALHHSKHDFLSK